MYLFNHAEIAKKVVGSTPRLRDKTKRDIEWMNAHLAGLLASKQKVRVTYTFDVSNGGIRRFIPAVVTTIADF